MADRKSRSVAKTISWRVVATMITTIIVFVITGSLTLSLAAGGVEVLLKLMVYYGHERAWDKISWGKQE